MISRNSIRVRTSSAQTTSTHKLESYESLRMFRQTTNFNESTSAMRNASPTAHSPKIQ